MDGKFSPLKKKLPCQGSAVVISAEAAEKKVGMQKRAPSSPYRSFSSLSTFLRFYNSPGWIQFNREKEKKRKMGRQRKVLALLRFALHKKRVPISHSVIGFAKSIFFRAEKKIDNNVKIAGLVWCCWSKCNAPISCCVPWGGLGLCLGPHYFLSTWMVRPRNRGFYEPRDIFSGSA